MIKEKSYAIIRLLKRHRSGENELADIQRFGIQQSKEENQKRRIP